MRFLMRWLCLLGAVLLVALFFGEMRAQENGHPFVDVTAVSGIDTTHEAFWDGKGGDGYLGVGQAWGDYDNDGFLDLYLTGNIAENTLYKNNGDGTFSHSEWSTAVSMPASLSGGAVWADYDNDGWRDLYVLARGENKLFRNLEGEGFEDVTKTAGVGNGRTGETATWGDYDSDGFLDLYIVNWTCEPLCEPIDFTQFQDVLYRNNGDGTFSDVSDLLVYEKLLGAGFAASFIDYDNDLDLDLYIINDEYMNPIGNVLFRNDGEGCGSWCWTDVSEESQADVVLSGMGIAAADYDNDADIDFYFSNMLNKFSLLENKGQVFEDRAEAAGVHFGWTDTVGWGTGFFDYNNDGWKDIYLATTGFVQEDLYLPPEGMHFPHPNYLFHNNQDGTFTDIWQGEERPSMGFAYADYDNDGFVDFVVSNWNEPYQLFHNETAVSQNWLTINLVGGGPINRDAVGSKVLVTTTNGLQQLQVVTCGGSLGAGNDMRLHFGLGNSQIESVEVFWSDGETAVFNSVPINQQWQITYGDQETPKADERIILLILAFLLIAGIILIFQQTNQPKSKNLK
ncbi:MAG: CRTAC1 family protein [Chloroflexota bacterium]